MIPARIGLSMELSVAILLVVLGAMNLNSFFRALPATEDAASAGEVHSDPHQHDGRAHTHIHVHGPGKDHHGPTDSWLVRPDHLLGNWAVHRPLRSLLIGIVHGLAGSAAVALLVLTTIHDPYWATAYLLVFGVGTIAGMMLITMSIATTAKLVGRSNIFSRRLAVAAGLLSLGFGLLLAYQIFFVHGLLSPHPRWTPS